jgi:divalent metal cation (Fe/Co/Zn/Cd) transporter
MNFLYLRVCTEQVQNLTGKSAPSSFLQQITFLCWNHDPRILQIDTVRAFHLGLGFLVEVDIVLPETMNLKQAHDIGQALQDKLEHINLVERAFVHLGIESLLCAHHSLCN